jgi:hypothetical protein
MPVVYSASTKDARMNAVVSAIGANGKFKLYAADGTTLLATFTLAAIAGTVSAGVLTLSDANGASTGILTTTASAAGTAAKAAITTSADVVVVTNALTVGVAGTDVILDNCILALGQTVIVNSGSFTHA